MIEKETKLVSTSTVTETPAAPVETVEREAVTESSSTTATMVELAQQITALEGELRSLREAQAQQPATATAAQLAETLALVETLRGRLEVLETPPEEEAEVIEVAETPAETPVGVPLAEPQPKGKKGGGFLSLF